MTPLRRAASAALVLTAALTGAACTSEAPAPVRTPPSTSAPASTPPPTPTPTASKTPVPSGPVDPLTGGRLSTNGVVAVKIDDTYSGRPQRNIDKADIVYIEEVEGGLTRLLAIFNTALPTVEAVRSTRAADPEIAAQYGPIGYVASGGQRNPVAILDRSPLRTSLDQRGGPGLARDPDRPIPYNLTANLATVAAAVHAAGPKSIGFTWAPAAATIEAPQLAAAPAGTHVRTIVGGTPVSFDYDARTARYNRVIDGVVQHASDGDVIGTPNVIVQFCTVTTYLADIDVDGNPNKYTHTVGTGKVVVFRDGKRIAGTWTRPVAAAGTVLHDAAGQRIALAPGGAWVVLVHTDAALGS